jgi:hypothetical protein
MTASSGISATQASTLQFSDGNAAPSAAPDTTPATSAGTQLERGTAGGAEVGVIGCVVGPGCIGIGWGAEYRRFPLLAVQEA